MEFATVTFIVTRTILGRKLRDDRWVVLGGYSAAHFAQSCRSPG